MDDGEKLLARMRASKAGWGAGDLDRLYLRFGFVRQEKSKHRFYSHPKYPHLYATVARDSSLAIGYVVTAIRLIDELKRLERENDESEQSNI